MHKNKAALTNKMDKQKEEKGLKGKMTEKIITARMLSTIAGRSARGETAPAKTALYASKELFKKEQWNLSLTCTNFSVKKGFFPAYSARRGAISKIEAPIMHLTNVFKRKSRNILRVGLFYRAQ
jgi:hypothetical protein